jgi:hypothetical protein
VPWVNGELAASEVTCSGDVELSVLFVVVVRGTGVVVSVVAAFISALGARFVVLGDAVVVSSAGIGAATKRNKLY